MRAGHHRTLALFVLLAVLFLPAFAETPVRPGRWLALDTPNFRILSEARASDTKRVARRLETLRACIATIGGGKLSQASAGLEVVVFRSSKTFDRYRGEAFGNKDIVGFFTGDSGRSWTAVNLDTPDDPFSVVYHEYLHVVTFRNFPDAPLWFHEGVAEFYSTFQPRDDEVDLGRPVQEHVAFLRQKGIPPLETVLRTTSESEEYNENDRAGAFYAASWLFTHYFLTGDADRRGRLTDYLDRTGRGELVEEAFASAFAKSPSEFRKELEDYLRRPSLPFLKITFQQLRVPDPGEPVEADPADASVRLGMLAAVTSRTDWSFPESHFLDLAKSAPPNPAALAGMGFVRSRQGRPDEAAPWFDRALAVSPDDPEFQRLAAANLLLEAYESFPENESAQVEITETPPGVLRARELLARSLASDEDNAYSMTLYGQTFLFEPSEKTGPGVAALEKARRMAPRNVEAVLGLVQLRAQRGEVDAARDLVENHLARIANPEELRFGRQMVITAAYEDARATAVAGDLEGALAKMKALRETSPDPALGALLEDSIGQLEAGIRHKKDVDEYNAAVKHAKAGRMDEARTIWARLAAEAKDEALRKAAEDALRRIAGGGRR